MPRPGGREGSGTQRMIQIWGFPEILRLWNQPHPPAPRHLPLWQGTQDCPEMLKLLLSLLLCFASQVQSVCSGGLVLQLPEVPPLPPGCLSRVGSACHLCCSPLPSAGMGGQGELGPAVGMDGGHWPRIFVTIRSQTNIVTHGERDCGSDGKLSSLLFQQGTLRFYFAPVSAHFRASPGCI